jgi:imidazolonepropionase-like amidohydrolase
LITAFQGATLIDGNGRVIRDSVLLLEDEYILEVGAAGEVPVPDRARIVDLSGKHVLPGLVDAHIHLDLHGMTDTYHENLVEDKLRTIRAAVEMGNTVRAGITTVRNAGSTNYIDIAVKRAVEEGLVEGPRILASGKIICMMTAGNEYFRGLYREADGVDENRRAAREQLKEGADFLKVMATGAIMNPGGSPGAPHLNYEEIRAVVEEGAKMGKHTCAHAHGTEGVQNAVRAGVRSIEHGTLADEEALHLMAEQAVFLVTTLCSNFWMVQAGKSNNIPQFMSQKAQEISEIRKRNLQRAARMGVRIAMGTDAGTPYNFHGRNAMELVQLVEQEIMTPMQAITAATGTAADAIDRLDSIGTLQAGKLGDLLILNRDPLQDIRCLQDTASIHSVWKEGRRIGGKVDSSFWHAESPLGPA